MSGRLEVVSASAAMDGGLVAISEVASALRDLDLLDTARLIGGTAVVLHQQRLDLDLPIRSTADADLGVPPFVLRHGELVAALGARGYQRTEGNRWERTIGDRSVATVDLLIPTYTSRARDTVRIGDIVTTEVPGLAEALRRPGPVVDFTSQLTTGDSVEAQVTIPDAASMLALKAWARSLRSEQRDAHDLYRCLEIARAEGVTADELHDDPTLHWILPILERELGASGPTTEIVTRGLQPDAAAQIRTRIRALLASVAGIDPL